MHLFRNSTSDRYKSFVGQNEIEINGNEGENEENVAQR